MRGDACIGRTSIAPWIRFNTQILLAGTHREEGYTGLPASWTQPSDDIPHCVDSKTFSGTSQCLSYQSDEENQYLYSPFPFMMDYKTEKAVLVIVSIELLLLMERVRAVFHLPARNRLHHALGF